VALFLPRLIDPRAPGSWLVLVVALAAFASDLGATFVLGGAAWRLGDDRRLGHEVNDCLLVAGAEVAAIAGICFTLGGGVLWAEPSAGALVGGLMLYLVVKDVRQPRPRR
jgi:hypothetical protein